MFTILKIRLRRRPALRNLAKGNWPSDFNFETQEITKLKVDFSEEIMEDSYEAINRFYQKENKRSKATTKMRKQAWQ